MGIKSTKQIIGAVFLMKMGKGFYLFMVSAVIPSARVLRGSKSKGGLMAVKILIRRIIEPHLYNRAIAHIVQLRKEALQQSGYLGGETCVKADNSNEILVISHWESEELWSKWFHSWTRQQIDQELSIMLESPAEYAVYQHYG